MPEIKSRSQLRWAYANRNKKGREGKAARQAVAEFHGRTAKNLPERKKKTSRSRRKTRA